MERFGNKLTEDEEDILNRDIISLLRRSFRPEFLNRIDEIVIFKPLEIDQIKEIVGIQLDIVAKLLSKNGINLVVSDRVVGWLAEQGYDPQLGARPVKRLIQRDIINNLSREIIAGSVSLNSTVKVDLVDGGILFKTN